MGREHAAGEPVAADRSGVGFHLGHAARLVWRVLGERVAPLGLDYSAFIVVMNVAAVEGATGRGPLVSEMVDALALRSDDTDAAVGRLTRLGLIETTPEDHSVRLGLLDKGRAMIPVVQNEAHWLLENALSGFMYEEIDVLTDHLRRVIDNLGGRSG